MTALAEQQKRLDAGELRDEVLRGLWRKGRACPADLANEFEVPMAAKEVLPVVKRLEQAGLIRAVSDPEIPAGNPYQQVYELVR